MQYFGYYNNVWQEIYPGNIAETYVMEGYAPLVKHTTSGTYYYHNDHLGTPILMTDEFGNVVWNGEYDPFGEVEEVVSGVNQPIRFPGQVEDGETGLYYNWHRYYSPEVGRYTMPDPIKSGTILNNYYLFGVNNPINYIDFLGLWSEEAQAIVDECEAETETPHQAWNMALTKRKQNWHGPALRDAEHFLWAKAEVITNREVFLNVPKQKIRVFMYYYYKIIKEKLGYEVADTEGQLEAGLLGIQSALEEIEKGSENNKEQDCE